MTAIAARVIPVSPANGGSISYGGVPVAWSNPGPAVSLGSTTARQALDSVAAYGGTLVEGYPSQGGSPNAGSGDHLSIGSPNTLTTITPDGTTTIISLPGSTSPPVDLPNYIGPAASTISAVEQQLVQWGVGGEQAFTDLVKSLPSWVPSLTWNAADTVATGVSIGLAVDNLTNHNYATALSDFTGLLGTGIGASIPIPGVDLAGAIGLGIAGQYAGMLRPDEN